ncbi:MAG: transcription termination/antitermination protein NusG [Pirellulaceae bacterium]
MPVIKKETDVYPPDLLIADALPGDESWRWYCLYTLSRREKDLVRRLIARQIACYCPTVPKRYRSPAGRLRTSHTPLFSSYVFLYGDASHRQFALTTNCVSRDQEINDPNFVSELRQIQQALDAGVPLTPEARLERGQRVRVRSGPFRDFEGVVIRREGKTRLLLTLNFLEQGVSMEMDEAVLVPV